MHTQAGSERKVRALRVLSILAGRAGTGVGLLCETHGGLCMRLCICAHVAIQIHIHVYAEMRTCIIFVCMFLDWGIQKVRGVMGEWDAFAGRLVGLNG